MQHMSKRWDFYQYCKTADLKSYGKLSITVRIFLHNIVGMLTVLILESITVFNVLFHFQQFTNHCVRINDQD